MREHTVVVDRTNTPTDLAFAPTFNVAVPFIDRHLDEGRADKVALRSAEGDVRYGELAEQVARAGQALLGLGLGRGERLLLVVKDSPEFFYLFWGAIRAGVVPVPLNPLLRPDDHRYLLEDSGAAALVYSPEYAAQIEPALACARPLARPRLALTTSGGTRSFAAAMAAAAPTLAPAPTTAEDDCFWLYSSGSTGAPKAAVHRHRDLVVTSQLYGSDTLGVTEDDVCYSAAKLFFAYGLGNALSFPLWAGATAVLSAERPTPASSFAVIERLRPTIFFGVPTLYAAQLQALAHERPDLSSLRVCVSAGEALPAELFERWRARTGLIILDGIGSTEALHIFISNRLGDVRPGSSGRVVPGYEVRLEAEAEGGGHREAGAGEAGRLWVKGRSIARCYWNHPERTARTMRGEWLDTGDTYVRDPDGYYVYCGRSDDMMKVGGQWCSPFEIEARLIEHPLVLEAAVVGRADEAGLIKPEAHVVLRQPEAAGPALAEELQAWCKQRLALHKYPRWVRFITELPKTATGKIQRYRLRQTPA